MSDSRFWIMLADDPDTDHDLNDRGWWGIVDEKEGGIVAYAGTLALAQIIRRAMMIGV